MQSYLEGFRAGRLDYLLGLKLHTVMTSSYGRYATGYIDGWNHASELGRTSI